MTRDALRRVVEAGTCAGCGACEELGEHVQVEIQPSGFLRPSTVRPLTVAESERFASYCPGSTVSAPVPEFSAEDHLLWGPIIGCRVAFATDGNIRFEGSSGGALTALLTHLLESGMVDAVIQTGPAVQPPYANRTVLSRSTDDVLRGAGSRYAPSAPLAGLADRFDDVTRYAFVGKPCDVVALRALARHDTRINQQIPYMLSFFCAGVPSLRAAEEVIDRLGVDRQRLREFRFRGRGWPGRATALVEDGSTASMSYSESWGEILSRHVQLRCRICPDGVGSHADVACADAWETDHNGFPKFEELDGISLVLTRTAVGEQLVRSAIEAGVLSAEDQPVDSVAAMQPGQVAKATLGPARLLALRAMRRHVPTVRGFQPIKRSRKAGLVALIKNFLGTLRRAQQGRLLH